MPVKTIELKDKDLDGDKVGDKLKTLQKNLKDMIDEIESAAATPKTKKEIDGLSKKARGLLPAVKQLIKDARDGDYIKSRTAAVQMTFDIYNGMVDPVNKLPKGEAKLPEPDKVIVKGNLKSKLKGSRKRELEQGYDDLIKEMKKAANYAATKVRGQFKPTFNKHNTHVTGSGNEWKAYIEKGTTNTKWRLYFKMDFNEDKRELTVNLSKVQEDH